MADRMQRELSLSLSQKQEVLKLLNERFINLTNANKNNGDVQKVNSLSTQKLSLIITKEQYDLYKKIRVDTKAQKDAHLKSKPSSTSTPLKEDQEMDF